MKFAVKTFGVALAAGLLGTVGAFASTIDLTNNSAYTTQTASLASGSGEGVTWSVTSVPSGQMTYTPFDGDNVANNVALNPNLAYQNDGIGVVDDEVSFANESLTMSFAGAVVTVTGVYVLDLFGLETTEIYDQNNVLIGTVLASANSPAGNNTYDGYSYYVFSTGVAVTSLTFKAGPNNDAENAFGYPDFALAAVTLAPVPVPAAGLLLLGGLGALGAAKRRRKAA